MISPWTFGFLITHLIPKLDPAANDLLRFMTSLHWTQLIKTEAVTLRTRQSLGLIDVVTQPAGDGETGGNKQQSGLMTWQIKSR